MPNDPQPTTGTGVLASAQNLVVPTRTETANAFANISELDPPDRSQHVAGSNIVLSVRLMLGVLPSAAVGFDFQINLTSTGAAHSAGAGAHSLTRISLAPGSVHELSIQVDHPDAVAGDYDLEAMVMAAPNGTGNYQQIALIPGVGTNGRPYRVV